MSPCRARLLTVVLACVTAGVLTASGGASAPPLTRLIGQSIMTGIDGQVPDSSVLARIRAGQIGGVILFGDNIAGTAQLEQLIAALQGAAKAGGNPPLLIAVDQEGGTVKRLPDGPPDLSAAAMGTDGSAAKARSEGAATGAYLKRLGINVDLAPVLDTPNSPSNFLGTRAFSRDPHLNALLGPAFLSGLQQRGVAATAKHFPGLGTATASTDTNHVLITTAKRDLDARLAPFKSAIAAGTQLVMVSNAGYTAFDPAGLPAVLSNPIVTGLLRQKLGFKGVVISDAMEAPGPSSRQGSAATAIAAGVDVLLYVGESDSATAYSSLVAAERNGTLSAAAVRSSAARIASLKDWIARH